MIYIVEDDENIGQMECYALKNSGFGTELFEDSESFFSAVARRLPTLVILDLMLPGEDGLTILRRLRDSAETRKIPIINKRNAAAVFGPPSFVLLKSA